MLENYLYSNQYQKQVNTFIEKVMVDEKKSKNYLVLRDNIFYAQGGGQKGDIGTLLIDGIIYDVVNTIKNHEVINENLLEIKQKITLELVGKQVNATLDWQYRYQQMRLHSALHLLHYLLGKCLDNHQEPNLSMINDDGSAINRYQDERINEELIAKIYKQMLVHIENDQIIETYPDANQMGFRYYKYLDKEMPCGGIHVASTKEIGKLKVEYHTKKQKQSIKLILE